MRGGAEGRSRSAFPLLLALCLGAFIAAPPAAAAPAERALRVAAGEHRSGDLVGLARPVEVAGSVTGAVVSVFGPVRVTGTVRGDVLALWGDAEIEPGATVTGDVLVVGGALKPSGAGPLRAVGGRVLTVAAVEAAFLAELETSPLSRGSASLALLGFRLFLLFLWLALGLVLLRLLPRRVGAAARLVPGATGPAAAVGLAAVLTGALLSAFLLVVFPSTLGLVLTGFCVAFLALAKAFGLAALFVAVGRLLTRRARRSSPFFGDPAALALGLLALGLASLLPVAGPLLWAVASLVGIGVAIVSLARPRPVPAG